ncbi:MAG: DNA mismatch repair endonuclease MutL [Prevotella histicola]|jgi:DNA mismatch repair protein mutL|uniref:DNA mismatch repair protein MutL n=1 Tax=Prevotella histicola TaxID=470565 RepID=A0A930N5F9_9BACT|nr:DNA mismatch repair endonuclease MutL [Prevotella histicola]MBF1394799.1 DNA mismatch repair endonuclease MutL [Prevotella histicola]MBF1414467.1 DNA mismatch repair endonuclease MutL [Prevotella histicola]MBW4737942.1 DNA mismatch repair endonuclease MutL [Prevotella histicola]MBW4747952.1 DNA mismatch repair endonuclease MutL [Prevotella histicola]
MSDIIQLLPDSVANQIAAGEVIQRPASVVKELVENAIDAGASNINVIIVDAGRTSIQVIDDGKGMSETDARLSFERHATSKIRKADDLFSLHTMGFRGEALASIAAVAQIDLKTRMEGEDLGTQLTISGSRFVGQEPCACPVGSNFTVENLFFNVPARRKFLKSNTTELNNIITAFERIVLVYPQISFTLHSNGTELFNLRSCSYRQRIVEVFGKRLNQDLLPIGVDTSLCRIHGFVGKPESARKKVLQQYFFVNERYMKHAYFHKAVMTAFDRLIPQGEQIPYFLYFEVPAENIDVNIHPTKTEIKFENEQAIWQILLASVKEAVGKFNDVPSIDFDTEGKPDIPVFNPNGSTSAPKISFNPQYNPFKQSSQPQRTTNTEGWESLYAGLDTNTETPQTDLFGQEDTPIGNVDNGETIISSVATAPDATAMIEDKSPTHYQYKGSYIMTAVKSGLMIINQHRAHVRILYEAYLRQLSEHKVHSQKVLFPEMVQFSVSDSVILEHILPEMTEMGFQLDNLGGGSYAVNGVPAGIEGLNAVTLITDMVAAAIESGTHVKEEIDHVLALSLARNAAIPQGQVLSNSEMESIVNELFACSNVNYTPSGTPIIAIMQQHDIEHLFDS